MGLLKILFKKLLFNFQKMIHKITKEKKCSHTQNRNSML